MSPPNDHIARAYELFAELFPLDAAARRVRLAELDEPAAVRDELASLLENYDDPAPLIEAVSGGGEPAAASAVPMHIGSYRVTGILGRGGMGIVYRAEQERPRREVALKVLPQESVDDEHRRRFEHEAEILGLLQHPNIARIYDAGTCDLGYGEVPFFAMELVDGVPLDTYADENDLTVNERCALMAAICDAVQYAHDHGVVHRDLKPGNILVADGVPKILDFGIARSTDADVARATLQTRTGQLLGTLAYMSPEQVTGDRSAVDPRSDVYALGVLLYELLAHRLPIDVTNTSLAQASQRILDKEPIKLGRIDKQLRGDLETIASKALVKDRSLRYGTARELAADLQRFLSSEPIVARPITTLYQLRKFAVRHKTLVGGIGATFLALVIGLIGISILAKQNEVLASSERETSRNWRRTSYQAEMRLLGEAFELSGGVRRVRDLLDRWKPGSGAADLRGWEWYLGWSRSSQETGILPIPKGTHHVQWLEDDRLLLHHADGATALDRSGKELGRLRRPTDSRPSQHDVVEHTHADATGRRIAFAYRPDAIRVYDFATGATIRDIAMPKCSWRKPVLSPDGRYLGVQRWGDRRWDCAVFDVETGETLATLFADPSRSIAFSPDSKYFAVGLQRHRIHVHLYEVGKWDRRIQEMKGLADRYWGFAFSPDSKQIAACGELGTLQVWDCATGERVKVIQNPHGFRQLVWHPDGKRIAAANNDHEIYLYDLERDSYRVFPGHIAPTRSVCFSPDGTQIASIGADDTMRFFAIDAPRAVRVIQMPFRHIETELEWAPDDRRIGVRISYAERGSWDLPSGQHSPAWRAVGNQGRFGIEFIERAGVKFGPVGPDGELVEPVSQHLGTMQRIAPHPTANRFAVGGSNLIRCYDWDRRDQVEHIPGKVHEVGRVWSFRVTGKCFATKWRPDGRVVATVDARGVVRIHDGDTGKPIHERTFAGSHGLAWSRDGKRLAIGCGDQSIAVWTVSTDQIESWIGHTARLRTLDWSPDGTRLASGADDSRIKIWDTTTGDEVLSLNHDHDVIALKWSPSGRSLASADIRGTLKIWDATLGYQRR